MTSFVNAGMQVLVKTGAHWALGDQQHAFALRNQFCTLNAHIRLHCSDCPGLSSTFLSDRPLGLISITTSKPQFEPKRAMSAVTISVDAVCICHWFWFRDFLSDWTDFVWHGWVSLFEDAIDRISLHLHDISCSLILTLICFAACQSFMRLPTIPLHFADFKSSEPWSIPLLEYCRPGEPSAPIISLGIPQLLLMQLMDVDSMIPLKNTVASMMRIVYWFACFGSLSHNIRRTYPIGRNRSLRGRSYRRGPRSITWRHWIAFQG